MSAVKPRKPVLALFLSLLLPGLGQVYNGQSKKAVLFFSLILILPFVFGLGRLAVSFYGLVTLLVFEVALRIYIMVDAVANAKRQKDYILKPYNTWYFYFVIAIGMIVVFVVYDITELAGIKTFKIPSTSNNPTLQVGDRLVADMEAYKNDGPDYGDIVVYSRPDGQIYAFRVVGLPGDSIDIVNNMVSRKGMASHATFIQETTNDDGAVEEYEEELPNGHKHLIYKFRAPYDSAKSNIENIIVPLDNYYVLGDNRDNAADSRYEGFISKDRIKGRVVYSYWGRTGVERMNIDFTDR